MTAAMKERWTEADVLGLPSGEHDYFERKGSLFLEHTDWREKLAKAISAFANSGGGTLLIGVEDNGQITGVSPKKKEGSLKDWLETILPRVVLYPLQQFRVHVVEPSVPSVIPQDKIVVAIDIGDSPLAPHQSEPDRAYYARQGGRSERASHFYLETLRNRFVGPSLRAWLYSIDFVTLAAHQDGLFCTIKLRFGIENRGNVAAYRWAVVLEGIKPGQQASPVKYYLGEHSFPSTISRRSGLKIGDSTILPGLTIGDDHWLGVFVTPSEWSENGLRRALNEALPVTVQLDYRAVSEFDRGTSTFASLRDAEGFDTLTKVIPGPVPEGPPL